MASRSGDGSVPTSSRSPMGATVASRFGDGSVPTSSGSPMEATVASKVDVLVDKAFAITISGTWTESVSLLRALARSWRAATTDSSVPTDGF